MYSINKKNLVTQYMLCVGGVMSMSCTDIKGGIMYKSYKNQNDLRNDQLGGVQF